MKIFITYGGITVNLELDVDSIVNIISRLAKEFATTNKATTTNNFLTRIIEEVNAAQHGEKNATT